MCPGKSDCVNVLKIHILNNGYLLLLFRDEKLVTTVLNMFDFLKGKCVQR